MFIADAHCDSLYALSVRGVPAGELMVRPELLADAGVGLQTYALFSGLAEDEGTPRSRVLTMLERVPALGVKMITGRLPEAPPETPHGILSIEGGEVLEGDLARLHEAHAWGVKMITLTWNYENEIGYPANGGSKKGLKPFGRELLREMDALGILCDVSHLNDAGIDDVLGLARLPVVASHSNARAVCDVPRNLAAEQVRGIAASGGFIGINFYGRFLAKGRAAVQEDLLRHIDAFVGMGAEACVGFGSDFDGIEVWPEGMGGPAGFHVVLKMLAARGMAVEGIAGGNLWRTLSATRPTEPPVTLPA